MSFVDEKAVVAGQSGLEYPVVYRVVPWVRILVVLGALIFGLAWTHMTFSPPHVHGKAVIKSILVGVDALLIAGLAYGVAWALTAKITLHADRFEQRKPFIRRVLRTDDILGRRYTKGRGAGYPVIVPKSGAAFSIDSTSYGLDGRFNHWFDQFPDLDNKRPHTL